MATTQPQVETVSTGADKAKLAGAALLVLARSSPSTTWASRTCGCACWPCWCCWPPRSALFFTSESGKQLIAFGQDSVKEVKKVVWPTRKEAIQMTGYVFAFVFLMALYMWLTDKTLEWLIFDVILGWRS